MMVLWVHTSISRSTGGRFIIAIYSSSVALAFPFHFLVALAFTFHTGGVRKDSAGEDVAGTDRVWATGVCTRGQIGSGLWDPVWYGAWDATWNFLLHQAVFRGPNTDRKTPSRTYPATISNTCITVFKAASALMLFFHLPLFSQALMQVTYYCQKFKNVTPSFAVRFCLYIILLKTTIEIVLEL